MVKKVTSANLRKTIVIVESPAKCGKIEEYLQILTKSFVYKVPMIGIAVASEEFPFIAKSNNVETYSPLLTLFQVAMKDYQNKEIGEFFVVRLFYGSI